MTQQRTRRVRRVRRVRRWQLGSLVAGRTPIELVSSSSLAVVVVQRRGGLIHLVKLSPRRRRRRFRPPQRLLLLLLLNLGKRSTQVVVVAAVAVHRDGCGGVIVGGGIVPVDLERRGGCRHRLCLECKLWTFEQGRVRVVVWWCVVVKRDRARRSLLRLLTRTDDFRTRLDDSEPGQATRFGTTVPPHFLPTPRSDRLVVVVVVVVHVE